MKPDLQEIDNLFIDLSDKDDKVRYPAFQMMLSLTEEKVEWVYDKWFELLDMLDSDNSFHRSIGFMLLANLSKSDVDNRMGLVIIRLLKLFDDEKFITSRQCIQNVWKIAASNSGLKQLILDELIRTYYENAHINKHGNLIKHDVISSMSMIYKSYNDESVQNYINQLIDAENDPKFVKALRKLL